MSRHALAWGMIGGGKASQIGDAHRIAAGMDRRFALRAMAADIDPARAKRFGAELGIDRDRAYGSWQDMVAGESARADGVSLVTVATPNATHFEISKACLQAGMHVLCEKPLTMTLREARKLAEVARTHERVLAVNFGYTGYPMIRQARAMIAKGDLGSIRLVVAQFAHGHHSDARDMDNPRVRWRYDPAQAGISSVLADCGIHAQQMVGYVTGQRVASLSAHYLSAVAGRELEDDASVQSVLDGGATCRLWTSAVALGHMHGLCIEVFGDRAAVRWDQEQPNQLRLTRLGKPTTTIERGQPGLYPDARQATRIAIGHPEGMLSAFANIYADLHGAIGGDQSALARLPQADDGIDMVQFVELATRSAKARSKWMSVPDR